MNKSLPLLALPALLTACVAKGPTSAPSDLPSDSIARIDTIYAQLDSASAFVPSDYAIASTPGHRRFLYDTKTGEALYALAPDEEINSLIARGDSSAYFTLYAPSENYYYDQIVDQRGRRLLSGPAYFYGLADGRVRAVVGLEEKEFDLARTAPGTEVMPTLYPSEVRRQRVQGMKTMTVVPSDGRSADARNTVYLNLSYEVPTASTPAGYAMGTWVLGHVVESLALMDTLPYRPVVRTRDDYSIAREAIRRHFFAVNDSLAAYSGSPVGVSVYMGLHWCKGGFYTYYRDMYNYGGGAHGYFTQTYLTYDFAAGRPLTASRLFRPECMDDVRRLLLARLAADRSRSYGTSITPEQLVDKEGDIDVDDTRPRPAATRSTVPALMPQGVVYAFQPYEYGSYADGVIRVVLPYTEVKPLLRPDVVRRLGL